MKFTSGCLLLFISFISACIAAPLGSRGYGGDDGGQQIDDKDFGHYQGYSDDSQDGECTRIPSELVPAGRIPEGDSFDILIVEIVEGHHHPEDEDVECTGIPGVHVPPGRIPEGDSFGILIVEIVEGHQHHEDEDECTGIPGVVRIPPGRIPEGVSIDFLVVQIDCDASDNRFEGYYPSISSLNKENDRNEFETDKKGQYKEKIDVYDDTNSGDY